MLQAVKRLVGTDRDDSAEGPDRAKLDAHVAAARKRLDSAAAAHANSLARSTELSTALEAAQLAFDTEDSEKNADAIAAVKSDQQRHELFSARTQRAVVVADGALKQAEQARDAVLIAYFDDRTQNVGRRLAELWQTKGKPAFASLAAFVTEAEDLLADSKAAAFEASRLRGADTTTRTNAVRVMDSALSVIRSTIEADLGIPETMRVGRFLGL